jgi:hypothetical protein
MTKMKRLTTTWFSMMRSWLYTVTTLIVYYIRRFLICHGYVEFVYRIKFGRAPNYITPQTFNEKLGWMRRYDDNPLYTILADKIAVRNYVRDRVGQDVLIPCYGIWKTAAEIPFETLPGRFVLKCNHESGFVVLCRDKAMLDQRFVRSQLATRLRMNYYYFWGERLYRNIPPQIMAEELLMDEHGKEPIDYKFHCFNGVPQYIYAVKDRHSKFVGGFYSPLWELLPFNASHTPPKILPRPNQLQQMLDIAGSLSRGLYYCRVDLYAVQEKVYFGEITILSGAGLYVFSPDIYDFYWGKRLILPDNKLQPVPSGVKA